MTRMEEDMLPGIRTLATGHNGGTAPDTRPHRWSRCVSRIYPSGDMTSGDILPKGRLP